MRQRWADSHYFPCSEVVESMEIPLEPEVLSAICRRGRRRLREIQTSCQAGLKLDRCRGVLLVNGSKESISMVQKQLEALSGPSLTVSSAVWAEAMRTRKIADPKHSAVACIQQESGCRIHIERDVQQVRLFGSKSETAVAMKLLGEFECLCAEEAVNMSCPRQLDVQILQLFAQDAGVTLKVEDDRIVVLGIAEAVGEAVKCFGNLDLLTRRASKERQSRLDGDLQQHHPLLNEAGSEYTRMAIGAAMAKLTVADNVSSASTAADSLPPAPLQNSHDANAEGYDNLVQGLVITKMPPPYHEAQEEVKKAENFNSNDSFGSCPTCGFSGHFCVHCGKKVVEHRLAGCQTCGVPKFCVYCGQSTRNMNMNPLWPSPNVSSENETHMSMPSVGYGDQQMQLMTSMPMMQMPVQTLQSNALTSQSPGLPMMMPECMMMPMMMQIPVGVAFQQGHQGGILALQ